MDFPVFCTFLACAVIFVLEIYTMHRRILRKADKKIQDDYRYRLDRATTGSDIAELGLAQHLIERAYASRSLRIAVYDKYTTVYQDYLEACVRSDLNFYHIRWLISLMK